MPMNRINFDYQEAFERESDNWSYIIYSLLQGSPFFSIPCLSYIILHGYRRKIWYSYSTFGALEYALHFFLLFFSFYLSFFLFSSIPHLLSLSVNAVKEFFEYSYSILSIGVGKYGLEITSLSKSYLNNCNLFCSSTFFIGLILHVLRPSKW